MKDPFVHFEPRVYLEGRRYYRGNQVKELWLEGDRIFSSVFDSDDLTCDVNIPFETRGPIVDNASCTCNSKEPCKHTAAALMAYLVSQNVNPDNLDATPWPMGSKTGRLVNPRPADAVPHLKKALREQKRTGQSVVKLSDLADGEVSPFIRHFKGVPGDLRTSSSQTKRFRVVFTVGNFQDIAGLIRPVIRACNQFIKKTGSLGRVEPFDYGQITEPLSDDTAYLLERLSITGYESPLALHVEHLIEHSGVPVYAARSNRSGSFSRPVSIQRAEKVLLSFHPAVIDSESSSPEISFAVHLTFISHGRRDIFTGINLPPADAVGDVVVLYVGDSSIIMYVKANRNVAEFIAKLTTWEDADDISAADVLALRGLAERLPGDIVACSTPHSTIRIVSGKPHGVISVETRHHISDVIFVTLRADYERPKQSSPDGEFVIARVNRLEESALQAAFREVFPHYDIRDDLPGRIILQSSIDRFLELYGEALLGRGFELRIAGIKGRIRKSSSRIYIEISSGIDWFGLHVSLDAAIDVSKLDLGLLESGLLMQGGELTYIGRDDAEKLRKLMEILHGTEDLDRIRTRDLSTLMAIAQLDLDVRPPDFTRLAAVAQKLTTQKSLPPVSPPDSFTGDLRPYQLTGYRWLRCLAGNGLNGCLADDMGLGKTVQALVFILWLKENEAAGRILVVAPVSTLHNWEQEARRFTPGLSVQVYHGQGRFLGTADITILSYATLRIDIDLFAPLEFELAVLDEAQMIKNPRSKIFKIVKSLTAKHRLTLTGTPLENTRVDLWPQMDFLEPGLLGGLKSFKAKFDKSTTSDSLRNAVKPFILRRTKDVVEKDLPTREEITLYAEMGEEQAAAYETLKHAYRERITMHLHSEGIKHAGAIIFEGLLRLRQAACFPEHADPALSSIPSAKLDVFEDLMAEILSEGHKVLVFSQFVKSLTVLKRSLAEKQIEYSYLDGSTVNREEIISKFQTDCKQRVFLLSLRAGGVGINLTAANYVVLFDPWWNPAVENQAIDRTHRIGQKKSVFVYRIVTRGSIEEKILVLQPRFDTWRGK